MEKIGKNIIIITGLDLPGTKHNIMNQESQFKYEASLHINADDPASVEFIGKVKANSIRELKSEARKHARSWNKHLFGRIHVEDADHGLEFFVNP